MDKNISPQPKKEQSTPIAFYVMIIVTIVMGLVLAYNAIFR
jgi:hypothetical protein